MSETKGQNAKYIGNCQHLSSHDHAPRITRHVARFTPYFLLIALFSLFLLPSLAHADTLTRRDGLPSDGVTSLAWDGGTLWVGTVAGLGRVVAGRAETVEFPLEERHILALHAEGGALWVGTARGAARWSDGAWQIWERGDVGLRSAWVTAWATHGGHIVAGTYGGGALAWDGAAWQPLGAGPGQLTALVSEGATLWAGTPRGLWAWDGAAWRSEPLPQVARVTALLAQGEALWVGTDAGLFLRPAPSAAWEQPLTEPVTTLALKEDGALAATVDGQVLELGSPPAPTFPPSPHYVSALLSTPATLYIGTLGGGVGVRGLNSSEAGEGSEESFPQPIVLLHGLGDANDITNSNLRFLVGWLRRDGHAVALVAYDEALPMLDNVAAVRAAVEAVKVESGQGEVVLLAHSLGGWLARFYLASGATDVAGMATLGTPHAGVRLSYDFIVPDLATDPAPALRELLPEHVALIAPFTERPDVPQLHVGGTLLPRGTLFAGFPPHDGIVTAASATAAPGATRLRPLLHGWTFATLGVSVPSLVWPDDLYTNTLRPWLASLETTPWQDRAAALPLPPPGFTQRVLFQGTLGAGESVILPVQLDGQPATWFLEGAGIEMALVAPDGSRTPAERLVLTGPVAHLPYRENVWEPLDLWSTQGQPGTWRAELRNQSTTATAARLALVEPERTPLAVTVTRPWAAPSDAVPLDVQAPPGQRLTATLGGVEALLVEGSPGTYRGVIPAPAEPGYHALRVTGGEVGRWAVVGTRSARWQVNRVQASRTGGRLTLQLTAEGAGRTALGVRVRQGETLLATRLLPVAEGSAPEASLPLPAGATSPFTVEWQLFDASSALVPITDLHVLTLP